MKRYDNLRVLTVSEVRDTLPPLENLLSSGSCGGGGQPRPDQPSNAAGSCGGGGGGGGCRGGMSPSHEIHMDRTAHDEEVS